MDLQGLEFSIQKMHEIEKEIEKKLIEIKEKEEELNILMKDSINVFEENEIRIISEILNASSNFVVIDMNKEIDFDNINAKLASINVQFRSLSGKKR